MKKILFGHFYEGETVIVNIDGKNYSRKVKYSTEAHDLYITVSGNHHFFCEFEFEKTVDDVAEAVQDILAHNIELNRIYSRLYDLYDDDSALCEDAVAKVIADLAAERCWERANVLAGAMLLIENNELAIL